MKRWNKDKSWSDRFLPEIKRILGEHLISEPPIEEDQERNTDLIVLRLDVVRVACRIRRPGYFEKYGDEFTIRAGRPSGVKTELTKIIEGWGDYFFYGHSNETEENLFAWWLADLKIFRIWFNQQLWANNKAWALKNNIDNSSNFMAFKWASFPENFIKAANHQAAPI